MKQYIGDSVYVDFDGFNLVLTTENGYGASNQIVLDPDVYASLVMYVRRIREIRGTTETEGVA